MGKIIKRLTQQEVVNAQAESKPYKLYDEGRLRLLVRPSGVKTWQVPYQHKGKANIYTIGSFCPNKHAGHTSLQEARRVRDEVQHLVRQGINPNKDKSSLQTSDSNTFKIIALEWLDKNTWVASHKKRVLNSLIKDAFPIVGNMHIEEIKPKDIISILEIIEKRNALDVAKRICQRCEAIFDYAIHKGLCETNPALGRSKFIKPHKTKHRPFLKEDKLPEFLHKLDGYTGREYIRLAMKLLVITFVRSGELRQANWSEIDWKNKLWRIPAQKMKMKRDHVVPLSNQALLLLKDLQKITGKSEYLFPSILSNHKPISDATLIKVLRTLGYSNKEVVPHGFRHTASTILNEHTFNSDHIERQLAHVDKNKIRGTYNHAEYIEGRAEMMQWYADHLDNLKSTM